jgi:DNA-binding NtrC family response regulator
VPLRFDGPTGVEMSNVVLLFEEEPLIRDLVGKVLTDAGCRVVACDSLEHLMRAADDYPGAVAVATCWGESEATLNDEERAQIVRLAEAVPTILLAKRAWASEGVAGERGLVAVVRKPFALNELRLLVTRTLGNWTRATSA